MKIRGHLTYANITATLALAGVVGGGGAYAAGVIDSGDIANNSIESKDLKNRDAVTNRDVRKDGLKGRAIKERTLDAADFAPIVGDTGACNPGGPGFEACASVAIQLNRVGRLFVIATGDFGGGGASSSLLCRIAVDGSNETDGSTPAGAGTDGFARTLVTDRLPAGEHAVALRCSETAGGGSLATASVAVLGING